MTNLLYLLLSLFYIFFLPGYLAALLFCKKSDASERLALGLGLSIIIIPIASFSIAMLMGTFVKETLVFGIATAINLTVLIALLLKKSK